MKIKKIEDKVFKVLQQRPETRSDDFVLVFWVFNEFNENAVYMPFDYVMANHVELCLPSFHSITRARRKIFENHPELKPKKITKYRAEKEEEFKEYSRT